MKESFQNNSTDKSTKDVIEEKVSQVKIENSEKEFDNARQKISQEMPMLINAQEAKLEALQVRLNSFKKEDYSKLFDDIRAFEYDMNFMLAVNDKIAPLKVLAENAGKTEIFEEIQKNLAINNYQKFNKKSEELIEKLNNKNK